jgi:hypothetical protein
VTATAVARVLLVPLPDEDEATPLVEVLGSTDWLDFAELPEVVATSDSFTRKVLIQLTDKLKNHSFLPSLETNSLSDNESS